ncbi:MAG TPA: hypothetical protein PLQ13_05055 [Candidatus Krumholzibacteria bacterium]|nr:hypothetical protein [Candidatus Krumholzibacteria bacterium]
MCRSWSILAIVLWTCLVLPAACPAGLVAHGCAEDRDPGCQHEELCAGDPCNLVALVRDQGDDHAPASPDAALPPGGPALTAIPLACCGAFDVRPPAAPAAAPSRGSLPLLC